MFKHQMPIKDKELVLISSLILYNLGPLQTYILLTETM